MKKPRRVPGDSPVDIGDRAVRVYREGKKKYRYSLDDLYDWLRAAGLSEEEADEMCSLEGEND